MARRRVGSCLRRVPGRCRDARPISLGKNIFCHRNCLLARVQARTGPVRGRCRLFGDAAHHRSSRRNGSGPSAQPSRSRWTFGSRGEDSRTVRQAVASPSHCHRDGRSRSGVRQFIGTTPIPHCRPVRSRVTPRTGRVAELDAAGPASIAADTSRQGDTTVPPVDLGFYIGRSMLHVEVEQWRSEREEFDLRRSEFRSATVPSHRRHRPSRPGRPRCA